MSNSPPSISKHVAVTHGLGSSSGSGMSSTEEIQRSQWAIGQSLAWAALGQRDSHISGHAPDDDVKLVIDDTIPTAPASPGKRLSAYRNISEHRFHRTATRSPSSL